MPMISDCNDRMRTKADETDEIIVGRAAAVTGEACI